MPLRVREITAVEAGNLPGGIYGRTGNSRRPWTVLPAPMETVYLSVGVEHSTFKHSNCTSLLNLLILVRAVFV